jgi:cell shape-determining protein MreC
MAVVAAGGVVGRIIGPTGCACGVRVQVLIDRTQAAGAYIERTIPAEWWLASTTTRPLSMDLVSNMADVKAGDSGHGIGS